MTFSSDSGFCSEASHGQYCTYGPKTTIKKSGRVLAVPSNYDHLFQSKRPLHPPPPLKRDVCWVGKDMSLRIESKKG